MKLVTMLMLKAGPAVTINADTCLIQVSQFIYNHCVIITSKHFQILVHPSIAEQQLFVVDAAPPTHIAQHRA